MDHNIEVLFDDGGGITVQTDDFAHSYDDAKQAATDVKLLLDGDATSDWDGNDDSCRINWGHEDLGNGGLKVYDTADLKREIASKDPISVGWHNMDDFLAALTGRTVMEY